ncbi:hypothetical protein Btru_010853 [Bulinus truncatus]|nr:hypothetical protein Btru_010853 [Bulinus truncatus]
MAEMWQSSYAMETFLDANNLNSWKQTKREWGNIRENVRASEAVLNSCLKFLEALQLWINIDSFAYGVLPTPNDNFILPRIDWSILDRLDSMQLETFMESLRGIWELTQQIERTVQNRFEKIISFRQELINDNFKFYVNPIMAVIGLCLNILTLAILRKDGLGKPTNQLMMFVVVAGIFQQISAINVADIIYFFQSKAKGSSSRFGDPMNAPLMIAADAFRVISDWSQCVYSPTYMLITINRLVAVFMPFRIKTVFSKKTISVCILFVYTMWLPLIAYRVQVKYMLSNEGIHLLQMVSQNINITGTLISMRHTAYYQDLLALISRIISKFIPLAVVILGSVAIAVKIAMVLKERQKLTTTVAKLSASVRAFGNQTVAKLSARERAFGNQTVAKLSASVRAFGNQTVAKLSASVRAFGNQTVAKLSTRVRAFGNQTVAKLSVSVRAFGNQTVAKLSARERAFGNQTVAKLSARVRAFGNQTVAKLSARVRAFGNQTVAKLSASVRAFGNQTVAKLSARERALGNQAVTMVETNFCPFIKSIKKSLHKLVFFLHLFC